MTKESHSFVDIIRQFGSDLGIPKVDVDKLVETHRKNFEAFTQTVLVASDGMKSLATKQKEMIDAASVASQRPERRFGGEGKFRPQLRRAARRVRAAY